MGTISFELSHKCEKALNRLDKRQQWLLATDCLFDILSIYERTFTERIPREVAGLSIQPSDNENFKFLMLCYFQFLRKSTFAFTQRKEANVSYCAYLIAEYYSGRNKEAEASHPIYWAGTYKLDGERAFDFSQVNFLYEQTQPEVPFEKYYKTTDTLGIAKEIYETKDFTLMPLLADALIDLGCPEEQADKVRFGKGYSNWALYHLAQCRTG